MEKEEVRALEKAESLGKDIEGALDGDPRRLPFYLMPVWSAFLLLDRDREYTIPALGGVVMPKGVMSGVRDLFHFGKVPERLQGRWFLLLSAADTAYKRAFTEKAQREYGDGPGND